MATTVPEVAFSSTVLLVERRSGLNVSCCGSGPSPVGPGEVVSGPVSGPGGGVISGCG